MRISQGGRLPVLVSALVATSLAACSSLAGGGPELVALSPGTVLFAAPPPLADCARIDVTGLRGLTLTEPPAAKGILTFADPGQPTRTWAGCVGPTETAATPTPAGGPPSGSGGAAATATGTTATPEGSTGTVSWLVRYATTSDAARTEPLSAAGSEAADSRTLIRSATLADARVRVELSVHADDHRTLVLVTVFDPRTGRNAAECGLQEVAGDAAEAAVSWCLGALAGQLVRRR